MVGIADLGDFPKHAFVPKRETGVRSFLTKYSNYDGRGTVIAVLDSGVDPAAGGLQVTTEGKSKIIARVNCTGSGDVIMKPAEPVNGEIIGLSGRVLKLPSDWIIPQGKYKIGLKYKYDLMAKVVRELWQKDYKEKWDDAQKQYVSIAVKKQHDFTPADKAKLTRSELMKKEDIESELDALSTLQKKYFDAGPSYDCVLFHDGEQWRCIVDITESGDLKNCTVLKEFEKDPSSYAILSSKDQITYSINIYNDGDILEIVTCTSTHGTHVASIAAACFPTEPQKNGVAPGAQILSLCIGDNRLNAEETGSALCRAMTYIMRWREAGKKIHVINMSYGEAASWCDTGRIGILMNQIVDKYGVIWVSSAANSGPGLFTVGVPPDISTTNIIGVGAYVSQELNLVEYSLLQKPPPMSYTWSSRGPTIDGTRGISISAPGGATTSVPISSMRRSQLYNGTSMSAPHVTGAIAIILSGLLDQNIDYTPYLIKRALENTAKRIEDDDYFAQGHGLLQVENAFDYLLEHHSIIESKVRFDLECAGGKGIIHYQDEPMEYSMLVTPVFFDTENQDPSKKISFEMNLGFTCNESWVETPKFLLLLNAQRNIQIKVDPTSLSYGIPYPTCVKAFDLENVSKGPVFSIDVTVIKPLKINLENNSYKISFKDVIIEPINIKRHFIQVPNISSYAVINITSPEIKKTGRFCISCIQILPRKSFETYNYKKIFQVIAGKSDTQHAVEVQGGYIIELAIAKYWNNPGSMKLNYSIEFNKCSPRNEDMIMHHAKGTYEIELQFATKCITIHPSIQLKESVCTIKPVESTISVLEDSRDIIPPNKRIFQLILKYVFNLAKGTEITINNAYLSQYLYESDYESQLWLLFDSNKRYISAGDAYPDRYGVKLEKGEYIIRQQIRHDQKELLDKLIDVPVLLHQRLANPINVEIYNTQSAALLGKKTSLTTSVFQKYNNNVLSIYAAPVAIDKLPKNITPGQYLSGNITFKAKDELLKKADNFRFKYILTDVSKKTAAGTNKANAAKTTASWEEYEEGYRDFMKQWLQKFEPGSEDARKLYHMITEIHDNNATVHVSMLQNLEPENKRRFPGVNGNPIAIEDLREIISISDKIFSLVNQSEILAHIGTRSEPQNDQNPVKEKTLLDQKKIAIIEAMARKGYAMCLLYCKCYKESNEVQKVKKKDSSLETTERKYEDIKLEEIDNLWINLCKFVDCQEHKTAIYFTIWHSMVFKNYGKLAKLLLKLSDDKSSADIDRSLLWVFEKLNWNFFCSYYANRLITHYPEDFVPF